MKISLDQSANVLKELFELKLNEKKESLCESALSVMIDFKTKYEIEDLSSEEESDELIFEYELWNFNSEEEEIFEFSFTRQILLKNEEDYKFIILKLSYSPQDLKELMDEVFWTTDFEGVSEWKSEIEKSDGYARAKEITPIEYNLIIDGD